MASKYLENFASLVPALQGNKAIRKVEKLRELGEIQSEAEYRARLDSILSTLSTDTFQPTFEYTAFTPGLSSSDQYNEMMDSIRDDLEVLFIEINNIFAVIKAHDNVFRDKLLDELNSTLEELEKEEARLTLVADTSNAFDDAFINTFSGQLFRLDRLENFANELLYDIRRDTEILDENNTFIDEREENATLPLTQQSDVEFSEANLLLTQTTATDFNIQLIDSDIQNILVDSQDSNWIYNVLKEEPLRDGAKLTVEMDLGDKRILNFLVIQPIADFPAVLENITYKDVNDQTVVLPNQTFFGQAITQPVKISFDDIIAKKFILTFRQRSSTLFTFDPNDTQLTIDDLRRDTTIAASANMLADEINQTIEDVDLLSVLPISEQPSPDFRVLYKYTFGFKNISTGLNGYRDNGYFISKAYSKNTTGLVGLDAVEFDTQYFDENISANVSVGSFEYSVIKKDYNGREELISSYEFPILPTGISSIVNERLFFSGTTTVVPLRFLGHGSDDIDIGVEIYRNNVLLVRGVDWRFADRLNPLDDADTDLLPGLTTTGIEILNSSDVIRNGIYTANYTPRHIAEPNNVTRGGPFFNYLPNNVTEHTVDRGSDRAERSDLFLKVAIRNNSIFENKTPKLEEYQMLVSSIDSNKYVRL